MANQTNTVQITNKTGVVVRAGSDLQTLEQYTNAGNKLAMIAVCIFPADVYPLAVGDLATVGVCAVWEGREVASFCWADEEQAKKFARQMGKANGLQLAEDTRFNLCFNGVGSLSMR